MAQDNNIPPGRVPSILILTKNEESNIQACLACFDFSDDVVVLDSYSSDRTVELAQCFPNVRVVQRKFDTWSNHSNWAMENIDFKHPWVYYSDADELMPKSLRNEIITTINDPSNTCCAYRLRYKNMFMGSWIRHGGVYPVWIIRLFMPDKIRYEDREVNAHPVVDGELGNLKNHFIHYSFSKGLGSWFEKHNSYSAMEAAVGVRVTDQPWQTHIKCLTSGSSRDKRRALKNLSFYPRWRGLIRFLYMYFFKLGLLDGRPGFHYAAMISMYEYWIELKMIEKKKSWQQRTDKLVNEMLSEE